MAPNGEARYQVLRLLGQGGMGEVYLARDSRLRGKKVAIKRIRHDRWSADDPMADSNDHPIPPRTLGLFEQEIDALIALDQAAIVKIQDVLDFSRDRILLPEDTAPWTSGLGFVMEYVQGETLRQRLRRGPLDYDEALDIFRQLTRGLLAAHQEHIVHRDLKPANIMLTPNGDVKILDFGLAKCLSPQVTSLTATGQFAGGTPEYMSPEQGGCERIDARSDLFSLGVILYQMLTQTSPFRGGTVQETFKRTMVYDPPPISQVRPELPKALSHLVDDLLAKNPDARPNDARIVLGRLETILTAPMAPDGPATAEGPTLPSTLTSNDPQPSGTPAGVDTPRSNSLSTAFQALSIGPRQLFPLLLVVLLGTAWLVSRQNPSPAQSTPETPVVQTSSTTTQSTSAWVPRVAVLMAPDPTVDADETWRTGLVEGLLQDFLSDDERLLPVPSQQIQRMTRDLDLPSTAFLEPTADDLDRWQRYLGSDHLVLVRYTVDTLSGKPLITLYLTHPVTPDAQPYPGVDLTKFTRQASEDLRRAFGLDPLSPETSFGPLPKDPVALEAFGRGLEALRSQDFEGAVEYLRSAADATAEVAPTASRIQLKLAQALDALGRSEQAREAAQEALLSADRLQDRRHVLLLARAHALAGNHDAARATHTQWLDEHPGDRDVLLALVQDLHDRNEHQAVIHRLSAKGAQLDHEPRLLLILAQSQLRLKQTSEATHSALRALKASEATGAREIQARSLLVIAPGLQADGDSEAAEKALRRAQRLFIALQDLAGQVDVLTRQGIHRSHLGELREAELLLEQALELVQDLGDRRRQGKILVNLGNVRSWQGQAEQAMADFRTAIGWLEPFGWSPDLLAAHLGLGAALHERGNLTDAETHYLKVLEISEAIGHDQGLASALTNYGELLYLQGQLDQSTEYHRKSLAKSRATDDRFGIAYDSRRLGMVAMARGSFVVARGRLEESLAEFDALGQSRESAINHNLLAQLDLFEGKLTEAEDKASLAEELLRNSDSLEHTMAQLTLARVHHSLGSTGEAHRWLELAKRAADETNYREAQFATRITEAQMASGPTRARRDLEALLIEAEASDFKLYAFETRLTLAECLLDEGEIQTAQAQLEALISDTDGLGSNRFSDRARQLLNPPTG